MPVDLLTGAVLLSPRVESIAPMKTIFPSILSCGTVAGDHVGCRDDASTGPRASARSSAAWILRRRSGRSGRPICTPFGRTITGPSTPRYFITAAERQRGDELTVGLDDQRKAPVDAVDSGRRSPGHARACTRCPGRRATPVRLRRVGGASPPAEPTSDLRRRGSRCRRRSIAPPARAGSPGGSVAVDTSNAITRAPAAASLSVSCATLARGNG